MDLNSKMHMVINELPISLYCTLITLSLAYITWWIFKLLSHAVLSAPFDSWCTLILFPKGYCTMYIHVVVFKTFSLFSTQQCIKPLMYIENVFLQLIFFIWFANIDFITNIIWHSNRWELFCEKDGPHFKCPMSPTYYLTPEGVRIGLGPTSSHWYVHIPYHNSTNRRKPMLQLQ